MMFIPFQFETETVFFFVGRINLTHGKEVETNSGPSGFLIGSPSTGWSLRLVDLVPESYLLCVGLHLDQQSLAA